MKNSLGLTLNVLGISLILSCILKYIGPKLALEPTNLNGLIGIGLTPMAIAIFLIYKSRID
jgi:hypothetical protein